MHRDELPIPEPCQASWDEMDGSERKRFCGDCRKHVHDLSALTEDEAAVVVSEPDVCVRYTVGSDEQIRFQSRRRFIVGLAVASAAMVSMPAAASILDEGDEPGVMSWAWDKVSTWWLGGASSEGETPPAESPIDPVEVSAVDTEAVVPKVRADPPRKMMGRIAVRRSPDRLPGSSD